MLRRLLLLSTLLFLIHCAEIDGICFYSCQQTANTTGLVLTLSNSNFANTTIVGPNGNFTFSDVPEGTYTLSAPFNPLYAKYSQSVVITSGTEIVEVNFEIVTQMIVYPVPNVTTSCTSGYSQPNNGTGGTGIPGVSSLCGSPTIYITDSTRVTSCGSVISRTFTILSEGDANSPESVVQQITIQNNTVPVYTYFPPDVTLPCPPNFSVVPIATASSACGTVTLTFTDTPPTGNGCIDQITRTWYASNCFATLAQTQVIYISDTTPPVFTSFPPNMRYECATTASGQPVDTGSPVSSDSCSTVSISKTVSSSGGPSENCQTVTNTFTATDQCGNSSSRSQVVTFDDTTPPYFTEFVSDISGSCSNINTSPSVTGIPQISDNCVVPPPTLTYSDYVSGTCPMVVSREWIATDSCGNEVYETQLISFQ